MRWIRREFVYLIDINAFSRQHFFNLFGLVSSKKDLRLSFSPFKRYRAIIK